MRFINDDQIWFFWIINKYSLFAFFLWDIEI